MQQEYYLKHANDSVHLGEAVIYIMTIGRRYYIGSAKKFRRRINEHMRELKSGNHTNDIVQKAWNKYRSVEFEVIEVVPDKPTEKRLRHVEQHYIDLCYGDELCMNIMPSASITGAGNARSVVINGITYQSVSEAAEAIGERAGQISNWLSGREALPKRLQFTEFRYADEPEQYRRDARLRRIVMDGVEYESVQTLADLLDVNKALIPQWAQGKVPVPEWLKIKELRYADDPVSKITRAETQHQKAVVLNGKLFESVAAAAKSLGLASNSIAAWISGRSSLPKKHGIYELRYEGTEQVQFREAKIPHSKTYIVDGVPEIRQDFIKRLGINDAMASDFVSGRTPIPRSYGITSVHLPGQPDRSRLSSRRRVMLNGDEYCGVTEAADSVGVNRAQFVKWLNGKAKPSRKYNIHSLHYA